MLKTITAKVVAATLVVCAIVLGATLVVFAMISTTRSLTHHLAHEIHRVDHSHEFIIFLNKAIAEAESYSLQRETEDRDEALVAVAAATASLNQIKAVLAEETSTGHGSAKNEQLFQQRTALLDRVDNDVNAIMTSVQANDRADIEERLESLEEGERLVAELEDAADDLINTTLQEDLDTIDEVSSSSLYAVVIVGAGVILMTLCGMWFLRRTVVKPVQSLSHSARTVASGDFSRIVPVTNRDEIGDLQHAFNQMVHGLHAQRTALEARNAEVERNAHTQQQLLATVQQLSTPLLPIAQGVVALPIVGHVDTQRADAIMQTLMQGVAAQRARVAILDVTGIAVLDTHVTKLLFQSIQAVELLGARVLVAGITATMAQVIVEQGIDFGHLKTYRDLGSALETVWRSGPVAA